MLLAPAPVNSSVATVEGGVAPPIAKPKVLLVPAPPILDLAVDMSAISVPLVPFHDSVTARLSVAFSPP